MTTAVMMCLALAAAAQVRVISPDDFKPGKAVDETRYRIHYDMTFVNDTTQLDSLGRYVGKTEPMLLDIGRQGVTLFYSYAVWQSDSIANEAMKRGENRFHYNGNISWKLYKNYPRQGRYAYLDGISTERYVCEEQVEEPKWEIVPDSTAEIMGYPCQLAVASYRGRQWSAWYTDEVPVAEGPWKLGGLPGLVLRAYDRKRQYVFECTGMREMADGTVLEWKGEDYEAIDPKTLSQLYRRYYADPVGYVSANPNVKVIVRDEHGNEVKMPAKPYNPIER